MATAVFGVFTDQDNANHAIQSLIEANVPKDRLTVERVTPDSVQLDLTEDERDRFMNAVGSRAILVRATVPDEDSTNVRMMMMRAGATTFLRTTAEDAVAAAPVDEVLHPGTIANMEFRDHFLVEYAPTGASYEEYVPAYEFGYHFGLEGGHENMWKDWNQVYKEAMARWEADHPGTWDKYQLAIQEGWATAPVRLTSASLM